ncbi:MAG: sensor domain-containing diguanylate cyclase [Acidimicrobiales bacterium]
MQVTPSRAPADDMVPIAARLDAIGIVRLLAALTTLVLLPALPRFGGQHPGSLVAVTFGYVLVTVVIEWGRRRASRRGLAAVHLLLVLDAVYLGIVIARTGGHQSQVLFLVHLHVIAVTLLVSYRLGLKVALLHAWLLVLGYAAADAGIFGLREVGDAAFPAAALNAATFLVVGLGAAACSSVNERTLRASRSELAGLVDLGQDLERVVQPDDVLEASCRHVCQRLGFRRATVIARDDDGWSGAVGDARGRAFVASPLGVDRVIQTAWDTGEPQLVRTLVPYRDRLLEQLLPGSENLVVAPLTVDGHHLGVVVAEWGERRSARIPATAVGAVVQTAAHTSLSLRSSLLLRKVEELATRDTLTGLANRRLFEEALTREVRRAERDSCPLSLIVMDLDHFKEVNDTHGHQAGDEVLRQVGAALMSACRAMDLPARYGGEEFVVLLPECDSGAALAAADRLRTAVTAHVRGLHVTLSAGVATLPENAIDADRLVAAADSALYEAKGAGRNRSVASTRGRSLPATFPPAECSPSAGPAAQPTDGAAVVLRRESSCHTPF